MRLFTTIALETGAKCNRKCWFCPNSTNTRPNEFMSSDLITIIAKELSAIKYSGRIVLYMYNEPMLDPRLLDIIVQLRTVVPKSTIMIATNADYVREYNQLQSLFDAGLNQLQINIYSNMQRYRELVALMKQVDAVEGNIYENTSPKKRVFSIEQKFDQKITPNSPKVGRFELSNRSGNVPALPIVNEPLEKMCVRPFRSMQINWKGEAVLCCNDYHADVMCGDVSKKGVISVWKNSKVLKKFRKKLLRKNRTKLKLCDKCSFKGGAYPHFVPKLWPELIKK